MKKIYIKPTIEIITQTNGEGLMSVISMPEGTVTIGTGQESKPGGNWGYEGWGDPIENASNTDDDWGF